MADSPKQHDETKLAGPPPAEAKQTDPTPPVGVEEQQVEVVLSKDFDAKEASVEVGSYEPVKLSSSPVKVSLEHYRLLADVPAVARAE